jgi:hypothetical protein
MILKEQYVLIMREVKMQINQAPIINSREHVIRVLAKTAALFFILNLLFAAVDLHAVSKISIYNSVIPGRTRFPFNDYVALSLANNLTTENLDLLFASHLVSAPKADDEYRVFILGDSSVWGYMLASNQTLDAQLNHLELTSQDKRVRFYNLGYPFPSLVQDLMILNGAMMYQPDLVIWFFSEQSIPSPYNPRPLVVNNPDSICPLAARYDLDIMIDQSNCSAPSMWKHTLIARRQFLADLVRLQAVGLGWASTGVDAYYPIEHREAHPLRDFEASQPTSSLDDNALESAFDDLDAGIDIGSGIPFILVNQPIFVSNGKNHEIYYNELFPRSDYDQYRTLVLQTAEQRHWKLLDLWNLLPMDDFTNTPLHRSPEGETIVSQQLAPVVLSLLNTK